MGLDDRRQATGRDSGECPKTVTNMISTRYLKFCIFQLILTNEHEVIGMCCVTSHSLHLSSTYVITAQNNHNAHPLTPISVCHQ